MKVLVTGVDGQLGHDTLNELCRRGIQCVGGHKTTRYLDSLDANEQPLVTHVTMDVSDRLQVEWVMDQVRPDAVIHCAAWTAVDLAEDEEKRKQVRRVNVDGTRDLALACRRLGCKMMYISTDYVFDGQGETPWTPDCQDFAPLNVYGQSKLDGERQVEKLVEKFFIVRTAWVYGRNGKNFISTMLRLAETHDSVRVVNDQIGTPTYTYDLARLLVDMICTEKYGYYHATNEGGYISWYDLACEIFHQAGLDTKVIPITSAEYGASKARRPFNSRLDKSKLAENGFDLLPDWRDALGRYLAELREHS